MTQRNQLTEGEIYYLSGFKSSKVEVMGGVDSDFVLVKILTASSNGKYKDCIGRQVFVSRRVLYPEGRH